MAKQKITVNGLDVRVDARSKANFYSLTDLAQGGEGDVNEVIRRWMRAQKTLDLLGVWETAHNPAFNLSQVGQIELSLSRESFYLSAQKWIEQTGAISIEARPGRYGGTWAHADIALHFANWLSPEFCVFLIKEFKRLKEAEAARLGEAQDVHWAIARANHYLQTASVREHLVPLADWNSLRETLR